MLNITEYNEKQGDESEQQKVLSCQKFRQNLKKFGQSFDIFR